MTRRGLVFGVLAWDSLHAAYCVLRGNLPEREGGALALKKRLERISRWRQ